MVRVLLGGLKGMPPVGDMISDAQVCDGINCVRAHFSNSELGRRFGDGRLGGEATDGPLRDFALRPQARDMLSSHGRNAGLNEKGS